MKASNIFRACGPLEFVAVPSRDFDADFPRVVGRIDKQGMFHGAVALATKAEKIVTPAPWQVVKETMEKQSMNWTVLRERARGEADTRGYTVKVG